MGSSKRKRKADTDGDEKALLHHHTQPGTWKLPGGWDEGWGWKCSAD